tara:strand:+ start:2270 stop:2770 length:501 start_codon:yes stop_codon:yes gene_type:complete
MKLNLPEERKFVGNALIWKRIVALIIDLFIINFIVQFSFSGLFRKLIPVGSDFNELFNYLQANEELSGVIIMATMAAAFMGLLYFVFMERKMYQTIGKKVMNIYVVSSQDTKISFWQHIVRNLLVLPVFPFFLLWVLDPVFMFMTSNNQRLSEILSRTRVVQEFQL